MGSISFPNLGLEFAVGKSFSIFGFEVAFYGVIMAVSMICGALIAYHEAKRTGQKVDDYIDYTLFGILGGIIGARTYYVIFEWDYYGKNLSQIFNLRAGGLAIYGGVIGAVAVLFIFCKIKKLNPLKFIDTAVFGLLLGQIIGRWGNFFNREAYGSFTDNIFAMRIPVADAAVVTDALKVVENGVTYVQVHPTFLYESVLNLVLLALLIVFRDKRKFYGETFLRYLMGYGIIRFFIEGLRTDQLQFHGVAVSQILSAVLFAAALGIIVFMRLRLSGKPSLVDPIPVKGAKSEADDEDFDTDEEAEEDEDSDEEDDEDIDDIDETENIDN